MLTFTYAHTEDVFEHSLQRWLGHQLLCCSPQLPAEPAEWGRYVILTHFVAKSAKAVQPTIEDCLKVIHLTLQCCGGNNLWQRKR